MKLKKYLILGKNGTLGNQLQLTFHDRDFIALNRMELDFTKPDCIKKIILNIQPDVVINAIGYTNVEKAESEPALADQINGYSVGVLAAVCRDLKITLVHFSTDYVFDGMKKAGYQEDDSPNPINIYGKSKKLGEDLLLEEMELETSNRDISEGQYFLIRTSWLNGRYGVNFIEKILAKAKLGVPWKVINDQNGCFTYAPDLAQQVKWLIESNEYDSGIYHITNDGATSWYEIARAVLMKINKANLIIPCKTEEFPLKAERPKNSILINTKLPGLRNWGNAVMEYMG